MTAPLASLANVHFLERHRCDYGGFGHVRATLKGMERLIGSGSAFDYAILLTGQDYPIKPNADIEAFFEAHRGRSFLKWFPLPGGGWENGGLDRIEEWHLRARGRHVRIRPRLGFRRRFPTGLRPYGGSPYWCLTAECVVHVAEFVRTHPSYSRFFRTVNVPDEIYFQTIVMNSPLAATVVNDDLRYVEWRDIAVAGGPAILGVDDLGRALSSPNLFARKFDATWDAQVLDLLDAQLDGYVTPPDRAGARTPPQSS